MRSTATALVCLALIAGGCGGERSASASAPPQTAAAVPQLPGDLSVSGAPAAQAALVRATLVSDDETAWPVRLEAIRRSRRARDAAAAPLLVERAERARTPLEQAAALDVLAAAHPQACADASVRLAASFVGEREDEARLGAALLRHRVPGRVGPGLALVARAGAEALFSARALVRAAGSEAMPALEEIAEGGGPSALTTLAAVLASEIGGKPDVGAEAARLAAAAWPRRATAAFAEAYGSAAVPHLRAALAEAGPEGRAEAAAALGRFANADACQALLVASRAARDPGERAACLLALGRLGCSEALPDLLAACRDPSTATDADGRPCWPVAAAALAGLATMPGEDALAALAAAVGRMSRPTLVAVAATALADRGDQSVLPLLEQAVGELTSVDDAAMREVAVAARRLAGEFQPPEVSAFLIVYRTAGRSGGAPVRWALLTDSPLVPAESPVHAQSGDDLVEQRPLSLTRDEVSLAISLRNRRMLDQLAIQGERVDDVDLLAR